MTKAIWRIGGVVLAAFLALSVVACGSQASFLPSSTVVPTTSAAAPTDGAAPTDSAAAPTDSAAAPTDGATVGPSGTDPGSSGGITLVVLTSKTFKAGDAHTVTIAAKDASGKPATGYAGTIHFTSSDKAAILPKDYTFTAADAGVHKFALGITLKTAGKQSVRVRDTATTSITGIQSGIVVSA